MIREHADQGRTDELEPIGVIDIGSNSVRLVVYEGAVRAPFPLFNEKILCGLGRSWTADGHLNPDNVERALGALRRFKAITRTLGAKNVHAIATAAVRDAVDGDHFIERARDAAGVDVQILSGEREAELAAHGIRMGFLAPEGIGGDMGGGSLELIDITPTGLERAMTLPLGGLRLIEQAGERLDSAADVVDRHLDGVAWLRQGRNRTFYAIGGTWRALAKLHMASSDYPLRVMHGYAVPRTEMIEFCQQVRKSRKGTGLVGLDNIARPRRETLPYGAVVMERLLERLRPKRVMFSIFGIREGLLYSYLSASERHNDPLLSFCDDYAHMSSRSVRHARELTIWTDRIWRLAEVDETPEERRLRHAACLLSDTGWRAHPDYRGEQSLNVLAHAGLTGIDHPGRFFLALSVYFRHAGRGEMRGEELSARLSKCVSRRYLERAQLVAAAVRTAHMLSMGLPGIVDETDVTFRDGTMTMRVPTAYAELDGERLRRRLRAFGDLLGVETEVVIQG